MHQSHIKDRALTAKLLTENDLMSFVKSMAAMTGQKLPFVAVRTKTQAAYFGKPR